MRPLVLVGPQAPPSGGIASHLDDLQRTLESLGASVERLDTTRQPRQRRAPSVVRRGMRLLAARFHNALFHVHIAGHNRGGWELAGLVAALAGRRDDALLTLHSGLCPAYLDQHRRCIRALASRYRRILCVNDAIAAALSGAGVDARKLLVVPAFAAQRLPLPLAPAGLTQIRRRHRPLLGAMIAPGHEYGADVLLEGYTRLVEDDARDGQRQIGLVLFGAASRDPMHMRAFAARGLGGRVHALGELERSGALAVLKACDVFIRPTRADGDAVSVREALALGVRVVASDAAPRPAGVVCFSTGSGVALAQAVRAALAAAPPSSPPRDDGVLAPLLRIYREAGVALTA